MISNQKGVSFISISIFINEIKTKRRRQKERLQKPHAKKRHRVQTPSLQVLRQRIRSHLEHGTQRQQRTQNHRTQRSSRPRSLLQKDHGLQNPRRNKKQRRKSDLQRGRVQPHDHQKVRTNPRKTNTRTTQILHLAQKRQ